MQRDAGPTPTQSRLHLRQDQLITVVSAHSAAPPDDGGTGASIAGGPARA
jgi:hypothetical protein